MDATESERITRLHRLMRRGRVFGQSPEKAWYPKVLSKQIRIEDKDAKVRHLKKGKSGDDSTDGVGLMFMALCGDISRQFEFIQQSWMNNPKHVLPYTNEVDPIAASGPATTCPFTIPKLPLRHRVESVEKLVSVRGGGYFLLPGKKSISFILDC